MLHPVFHYCPLNCTACFVFALALLQAFLLAIDSMRSVDHALYHINPLIARRTPGGLPLPSSLSHPHNHNHNSHQSSGAYQPSPSASSFSAAAAVGPSPFPYPPGSLSSSSLAGGGFNPSATSSSSSSNGNGNGQGADSAFPDRGSGAAMTDSAAGPSPAAAAGDPAALALSHSHSHYNSYNYSNCNSNGGNSIGIAGTVVTIGGRNPAASVAAAGSNVLDGVVYLFQFPDGSLSRPEPPNLPSFKHLLSLSALRRGALWDTLLSPDPAAAAGNGSGNSGGGNSSASGSGSAQQSAAAVLPVGLEVAALTDTDTGTYILGRIRALRPRVPPRYTSLRHLVDSNKATYIYLLRLYILHSLCLFILFCILCICSCRAQIYEVQDAEQEYAQPAAAAPGRRRLL